jgi:hypothetical protein
LPAFLDDHHHQGAPCPTSHKAIRTSDTHLNPQAAAVASASAISRRATPRRRAALLTATLLT